MKIILTGKPGCGKSTLVARLIKEVQIKLFAGIITPEIREKNQRIGFEIIDLKSREKEVMASVNFKDGPKVSKYRVNVENIDKILDKFLESLDKAEIVFIDEIGKMEYFSPKFKETLKKVFDSKKLVIATVGLPFVNKFRDKTNVYYLEDNLEEVFEEIQKFL